jgi:hypothetical protein
MEQLLKIKDSKIQSLVSKLQKAGIAWLLFYNFVLLIFIIFYLL